MQSSVIEILHPPFRDPVTDKDFPREVSERIETPFPDTKDPLESKEIDDPMKAPSETLVFPTRFKS